MRLPGRAGARPQRPAHGPAPAREDRLGDRAKGRADTLALACATASEGLLAAVVDHNPKASVACWGDRRGSGGPVFLSAQPPRLAPILTTAAGPSVALAVVDTAAPAEHGPRSRAAADMAALWTAFGALAGLPPATSPHRALRWCVRLICTGRSSTRRCAPAPEPPPASPGARTAPSRGQGERDHLLRPRGPPPAPPARGRPRHPLQALLGKAINDLFSKHGQPELVERD